MKVVEVERTAAVEQTRDSVADIWGERTPYYEDWPERVDGRVLEEPDHWVKSCCVLCTNGWTP